MDDMHDNLANLELAIGYEFKDRALLVSALTHRSFLNESDELETDNQRLEFLGDAVLSVAIATNLYERFPGYTEGPLSATRAGLVNDTVLAELARKIDLGSYLWLGQGETSSGGSDKGSILADAYEALIAAVYLDSSFDTACEMVLRLHGERLEQAEPRKVAPTDYKGKLQKLVQNREDLQPNYRIVDQVGPAHHPVFKAVVTVGNQPIAIGEGSSKKAAEQAAALLALEYYDDEIPVR